MNFVAYGETILSFLFYFVKGLKQSSIAWSSCVLILWAWEKWHCTRAEWSLLVSDVISNFLLTYRKWFNIIFRHKILILLLVIFFPEHYFVKIYLTWICCQAEGGKACIQHCSARRAASSFRIIYDLPGYNIRWWCS